MEPTLNLSREEIGTNLRVLLTEIELFDPAHFDLNAYINHTGCGTLYCAGGLATTMEHFKQYGLQMFRGGPSVQIIEDGITHNLPCIKSIHALFGPGSFRCIFERFGDGFWDDELLRDMGVQPKVKHNVRSATSRVPQDVAMNEGIIHHQLVMARFERYMKVHHYG